jgi:SAM-dependent methyltransferase
MTQFDPASFRDPSGRLFRHSGAIYRTCSHDALNSFVQARDTGLIDTLTSAGLLVPSTLVDSANEGLDPAGVGEHVIRQAELPLVSYNYEWSFSMLRDAALVTLRSLDACLEKGFVLKDATAFNVLFEGAAPRLVDVHSLERRTEGSLWAGYAQFCRAFLFPLLLFSHKGIDPRPMLLAGLGEIPVADIHRVMGWRDIFRRGVLVNVSIQQQLEKKFAGRAEDVRKASSTVKYPLSALRAQVRKLHLLVEALRPPPGDAWTTYVGANTYQGGEVQAKKAFVSEALGSVRPAVVLDLGTNTGQYARLARQTGARVIAVDVSSACVDAVYREAAGDTGLSTLVADLTRPTPAAGWRLIERKSLPDRLRGDFVLALALIHHLRITGGIPLEEIVSVLTASAPAGVIEWVGREDSMVRRLLALRPDVYADYSEDHFQALLSAGARIERRSDISRGSRVLYFFDRR